MRERQLYLMRHGIAIDREDPQCPPDPDRPLTEKGKERTREVAEALRRLELTAEAWWSSPYRRALETAEITAKALGVAKDRIEEVRHLGPGATPAGLFRRLHEADASSVLCFGHLPNLDEVVRHAVGAEQSLTHLKKAGVVAIELDGWEAGTGMLQWLVTPKLMRALKG